LIRTRRGKDKKGSEKIDHVIGDTDNKYYGDWEHSECGINAKDVSDAVCGSVWSAYNSEIFPSVDYNLENKKLSKDVKDKQEIINHAYKQMHKFM
jgi:hypothetical protein